MMNATGNYIPSQALVAEYNLKMENGVYFIGAVIQTKDLVDETTLMADGVIVEKKADKNWTSRIPVLKLDKTRVTAGVEYIQIEVPANLK